MASLPDGAGAVSPEQPTASDIAKQFILAYYKTETSKLQQFYNQDSVVVRADPNLAMERNAPVVGITEIGKKLSEGDSKSVRVAFDSIDSQETGGGVVIVLTGILTSAGTNVRAFTQTFILAQETTSGLPRYYVRNDVFRYLSKNILSSGDTVAKTPTNAQQSMSTQTPKASTAETSTTTAAVAVSVDASTATGNEENFEAPEKVEASVDAAAATDSAESAAPKAEKKDKKVRTRKTKKPKEEKGAEVASEAKVEKAETSEPEPEKPSEAPAGDDEKVSMPPAPSIANSWAGRLFFKPSAAVSLPPLPFQPPIAEPEDVKGKKNNKTPKVKGPKTPKPVKTEEAAAGRVNGTKPEKIDKAEKKGEDGPDNRFSDELSVYVANLNKPIKKEEVKALFEPFGKVENVHLVLGKNFCFVRFESADSVEKALNAATTTPIVLNDATLTVSRKKTIRDRPTTATRGAFRGGREGGRAGGRGGATFKANGAPKAEAKPAESNDGFTEATRKYRKQRPQTAQ